MTYKQLLNSPMPKYTKGEEIFNYVTHIVGAAIGLFTTLFSSIYGSINNIELENIISMIIFGSCTIILYTISSLYHALPKYSIAKKIFRILDHSTIYLLIAGTYTPICINAFNNTSYCLVILILEWGCAIVGITLKVIDLNNKIIKIITMFLYVIMGWAIIIFPNAINFLSAYQFILILIGGIVYTVGISFFITGAKYKWFHSVFHIFCCIGTIVQTLGVIDIFIK